MRSIDLSRVKEAEEFGNDIKPGGYVCVITRIEDVPSKEYLKIEFDVADGEFKGYYTNLYKRAGFWGGSTVKSYKESALPFFKAFITAVEKSNPGYHWNNDENTLLHKRIGLVLREEEYENKYGDVKTKMTVAYVHSIDRIKNGDFKVPDIKKLKTDSYLNRPAEIGVYPAQQNNNQPLGDLSDFAEIPSNGNDKLPWE